MVRHRIHDPAAHIQQSWLKQATPDKMSHISDDMDIDTSSYDMDSDKHQPSGPLPKNTRKLDGAKKYSTKFNPDWTKKWPCIVPATKYKFRSTILCHCLLSCEHQGEKDVRRHLDGKKALRYCWGSWEAAMNFSVFLTQYSSNPWKDDLSRGQGEYSACSSQHSNSGVWSFNSFVQIYLPWQWSR